MDNHLPGVDALIKMAQDDPEGLELLREQLCRQLIKNAPEKYQRRLNGLQFQIDMARKKSNNDLHSCIKLSEMMMESYQNLQSALNDLKMENTQVNINETPQACADIIDFKITPKKA